MFEKEHISDDDYFQKYLKAHLDRGAKMIHSEFKYSKDFVLGLLSQEKGIWSMPYDLSQKLKIAVTTRALFKLEDENRIFEEKGRKVYEEYQISKETDILNKGAAFSLVKALLGINSLESTKDRV